MDDGGEKEEGTQSASEEVIGFECLLKLPCGCWTEREDPSLPGCMQWGIEDRLGWKTHFCQRVGSWLRVRCLGGFSSASQSLVPNNEESIMHRVRLTNRAGAD